MTVGVATLRRALGGVGWYLREVTGEGDYDRYVAHHACHHPGEQPLSRRDFERRRMDERERNPRASCC
jgi:uncharacterized short protein YbdD (DUF466 family)